jgi:hypothetical protein
MIPSYPLVEYALIFGVLKFWVQIMDALFQINTQYRPLYNCGDFIGGFLHAVGVFTYEQTHDNNLATITSI